MCELGTTLALEFPATGVIDVDECIAPIVAAMNLGGVKTIASCCGHGHRPGSIILADDRELMIFATSAEARGIDHWWPDINGHWQTKE